MRNKISSVTFGLFVFIFTLFGCVGCISISKNSGHIIRTTTGDVLQKESSLFPIESFVHTRQSFLISSEICSQDGKCQQQIIGNSTSVASGVIVKSSTPNSYVLTAGHVCVPPAPNTSIPGEVTVSYKITAQTGFGRSADMTVINVDLENDLCLLSAETYMGPGLSVQEEVTKLHAKIYNMASPNGLGTSLAVPVFDGYYIGKVANRTMFTLPAAPGSSGSPIMNDKNEIITVISAAAIRFDEFAICPTTEAVKAFLLANIPAKKKKSLIEKLKGE